ncbi:conserved hypothetical protein [uncultured Defluviicoccus sp.]|uniref:Spore protein YkvP/CgeB glycosyl transferase-like domain-containing protein n=1 Tax=metagenome TaxID=256318 RepID=A0A380TKC6_9ZZZZ|nr:conserved hypothetical protein [uncultured Defluviicoccus sp.]
MQEADLGRFMPFWRAMPLKVIRRVLEPLITRDYNSFIVNQARMLQPVAFVTMKGARIAPGTLRSVGAMGIPSLNYYPDFCFSFREVDEDSFHGYAHFFTTKSYQVAYLRERLGAGRVSYLPHGYTPDIHHPPANDGAAAKTYQSDLGYVGNHSAAKERWLSAVRRRLPYASLRIYGARWRESAKDEALRACCVGRTAEGCEYAQAVYTARINLAVHMGVADHTGWQDLTSARTFEIPACKGFMLHIDNDEVRSLYTVGDEIDVFKNPDELCEKIEYYLAHDDQREAMIDRADCRCVPAYSYDERAKVISDWIHQQSGDARHEGQ